MVCSSLLASLLTIKGFFLSNVPLLSHCIQAVLLLAQLCISPSLHLHVSCITLPVCFVSYPQKKTEIPCKETLDDKPVAHTGVLILETYSALLLSNIFMHVCAAPHSLAPKLGTR